jgi:hypothetical protein
MVICLALRAVELLVMLMESLALFASRCVFGCGTEREIYFSGSATETTYMSWRIAAKLYTTKKHDMLERS